MHNSMVSFALKPLIGNGDMECSFVAARYKVFFLRVFLSQSLPVEPGMCYATVEI